MTVNKRGNVNIYLFLFPTSKESEQKPRLDHLVSVDGWTERVHEQLEEALSHVGDLTDVVVVVLGELHGGLVEAGAASAASAAATARGRVCPSHTGGALRKPLPTSTSSRTPSDKKGKLRKRHEH